MTPTRSDTPIRAVRDRLLADGSVFGPVLRLRLVQAYDAWLTALVPDGAPVALVAVGGYGRAEPAPYSDLDLVLLHDSTPRKVAPIADAIWYPIWDSGIGLDHSVRTVEETARRAADDVKVALGVLDIRFVAGDADLAGRAREQVAAAWRVNAHQRAEALQAMAMERIEAFGQIRYLLQPHLKQSYGGVRDATILRALARAQLIDVRRETREALRVLLDVRGEVQRITGRSTDVLQAQDRAAVASALGILDDIELLRQVTSAGHVIGRACDLAWARAATRRAESSIPLRTRLLRPSRISPPRQGLAKDVVQHGGAVALARDAEPRCDRALTLRVARAAAHASLPISSFTLDRLRIEAPPETGEPWTAEMRADFDALLAAGQPLLRVWESLDEQGLIERLLPEWLHVRSLAQRNAVHTYTVDRHLLETVIRCGALSASVARPDLLRLAALLHDIGKGHPGDHSEVGARLTEGIVARMGLTPEDAEIVVSLVRHHLTLADVATRRDLADPRTVQLMIERIGTSTATIDLLQALTEADALAAGPAAWSRWKADLVGELAARLRSGSTGLVVPAAEVIDELVEATREQLASSSGDVRCAVLLGRAPGAYQRLVIAVRDGLALSGVFGALALESLDVRRSRLSSADGVTVADVIVEPRFGAMPSTTDLAAAIHHTADTAALSRRLAAKAAAYDAPAGDPELLWFDGEATGATVLEVRTEDGVALLHRLLTALEHAGVVVRSAAVETYGPSVVDSFYLTTGLGATLSPGDRAAVAEQIR